MTRNALIIVLLIFAIISVMVVIDRRNEPQQVTTTYTPGEQIVAEFVNHWSLHRTLDKQSEGLFEVDLSPDGKRFVTACLSGEAQVWDFETGEIIQVLKCNDRAAYRCEYSPDGTMILVSGNPARIWDASTFELLHSFPVQMATFTANSRYIYGQGDMNRSGTGAWSTYYFDSRTGKELKPVVITPEFRKQEGSFPTPDRLPGSDAYRWPSPDGSMIAQWRVRESEISIWRDRQQIGLLEVNGEDLRDLIWTTDSLNIITVGMDGAPQVWGMGNLEK